MSASEQTVAPGVRVAIEAWHAAVNAGDAQAAQATVGDPVVVLGPRGSGPLPPAEFAQWVVRSGIRLEPQAWLPVSERLMVVEQDATWPGSDRATRVATVFRVAGGTVTAALRLPGATEALELARVLRDMAATE